MARERKYTAGVTLADLANLCRQLQEWHDLFADIRLQRMGLNDAGVRIVVDLYEGRTFFDSPRPIISQNGGLSLRGEGQWSQMMLVLQQAVAAYEENPWFWTARTRRREVPTQVDSTPL